MSYTIGEMARMLGVAPSTLRYYEKEGLLPNVERTSGGGRRFTDKDFEWFYVIDCLKCSGLSIKDIREYLHLAGEGDATIDARLEMLARQREIVRGQMEQLQKTLDLLNYKCWFYETAKAAGSTDAPKNIPDDQLPENIRRVRHECSDRPDRP